MDAVQTLSLSALETGGKITITLNQGVADADGAECTRRLLFTVDALEPSDCADCTAELYLQLALQELSLGPWTYFHSEACTDGHEEAPHA